MAEGVFERELWRSRSKLFGRRHFDVKLRAPPVVAEGVLAPPQPATTMHATTPAIDAISLRERRLTDARRKR